MQWLGGLTDYSESPLVGDYPPSNSPLSTTFLFCFVLLAQQSGAHRISAYRDFQSQSQSLPLIAFEHLSLSIVIRNSASRPRQINVDQGRPKQVSILQVSKYPSVQVSQVSVMIVHSDNDVLSHVICKQVFLVTMCRKEPRP